jgi:chromate transporter
VAVLAFIAIFALQAPFPLIVLAAAVTGWLAPQRFSAGGGHAKAAGAPPAGRDRRRHAATAARALPLAALLAGAGVCLGLWLAVMALLLACFGVDAVLTQMAWFFSKAALLTFGGAYAVLPYVFRVRSSSITG